MEIRSLQQMHTVVYTVGRVTPTGVSLLGTCFLLNKNGLFATAGHVVSNDDRNLVIVISNNTDITGYQDMADAKVQAVKANIYAIDSVRDICVLRVELDAVSNVMIGSADEVNPGNELAVFGFPHCVDGRKVLTYQRTIVGAKILITTSGIKTKHLILNIQTRPGQSGSPILNASNSKVIAMIIGSYAPQTGGTISLGGVDPNTLHQTTHAISAEYILDMI